MRTPQPIKIDIRNHKKDGTPFWNRLLLAPVHDAGGRLTYFFASQLDVTVERERLAELERQSDGPDPQLQGHREGAPSAARRSGMPC